MEKITLLLAFFGFLVVLSGGAHPSTYYNEDLGNGADIMDMDTSADLIEAFEEVDIKKGKTLSEVRKENAFWYYQDVNMNSSLKKHLEYGIYTRDTPEIRDLSEFLWETDYVYANSYSYGSKKFKITEDPIFDYINKSWWFVSKGIGYPFVERQDLLKQIDANTTLSIKLGYCDDKDILFKSLMLQKGIPAQIRILEKVDKYGGYPRRHSALFVWWNKSWYKVDPTYPELGRWLFDGEEYIIYQGAYPQILDRKIFSKDSNAVIDVTNLAPLDEGYKIHAEEW